MKSEGRSKKLKCCFVDELQPEREGKMRKKRIFVNTDEEQSHP